MVVSVVQSVAAAQQFAVPDLLPWRLLKRVLLTKLVYNERIVAHSQAGKLMIVIRPVKRRLRA
jgi:hypothetical protein